MTSPTRRYRRTKVDIRVKLFVPEGSEHGAVVRTFEMSEGGMSLYVSETLPVGERVQVELSLPGSKAFRVAGVVRNVRGFRCGLELIDVSKTHRAAIARYLTTVADVIEI